MSCFGFCGKWKKNRSPTDEAEDPPPLPRLVPDVPGTSDQLVENPKVENPKVKIPNVEGPKIELSEYTFRQLVEATEHFRPDNFLGEGGFGRVYKGRLMWKNQIRDVAIKQLNRDGGQGNREFIIEAFALTVADHPNLVKLFGICSENDQRMPLGSVDRWLFDLPEGREPLDWNTRMKIAAGVAAGLEYLHDKMDPPIIYRDLKCSNILLGEGYHPKLSDFGCAKRGPEGGKDHVSTRVMGTPGYIAPEYVKSGELTFKSDMYCFGVSLFELITGRKAMDSSKPKDERLLVNWVKPFVRAGNYSQLADPGLNGQYPEEGLERAINTAYLCVQEDPMDRLLARGVKKVLDSIAKNVYDPQNPQDPQNSEAQELQNPPNPEAHE